MAIKMIDGYKVSVSETDHYNRFTAVLDDHYDGAPDTKYGLATAIGHGDTEEEAIEDLMEQVGEITAEDDEPHGSYDLSDDGDALASAGWGTDEDYGGYGGEDY